MVENALSMYGVLCSAFESSSHLLSLLLLSKNTDFVYYWRCTSTSWCILVKLLVMMVNSNNYTEFLTYCNEYSFLFLVALWLWCLTMWVLAASTLSLTVCAECCVFTVDSAAVLKQVFCTTSQFFCVAQSSESIVAETSILATALNLKYHNVSVLQMTVMKNHFHKQAVDNSNLTASLTWS